MAKSSELWPIPNAALTGLTVDTNTLVVDSVNNRVGIGTTTPVGKLTVLATDDSVAPAVAIRQDGAPGNGWDFLLDTAVNGDMYIKRVNVNTPTDFLTFNYQYNRLGIGTTPTQKLQVGGAISGGVGITTNTNIAVAVGQTAYLVLLTNQYDAGSSVRSALYHILLNYEGTAIAYSGLVYSLNSGSYTFDVSGGYLRVATVMVGNNRCSVFTT